MIFLATEGGPVMSITLLAKRYPTTRIDRPCGARLAHALEQHPEIFRELLLLVKREDLAHPLRGTRSANWSSFWLMSGAKAFAR